MGEALQDISISDNDVHRPSQILGFSSFGYQNLFHRFSMNCAIEALRNAVSSVPKHAKGA